MSNVIISSGVTSSGLTVVSGESLTVNSGGKIVNTLVNNGGVVVISSGGGETGTTLSSGAIETVFSGGAAGGDVIFGTMNLISTASAVNNETVVSGGLLTISKSATVSNTTLVSGGTIEFLTQAATLAGTVTFSGGGNTLEIVSNTTTVGANGDLGAISGFTGADKIDDLALTSAGTTLTETVSNGNTYANLSSGGLLVESFIFSGATTYTSNTLSLIADAGGHAEIVYSSSTAPPTSTTSVTTSTASGAYTETSGNTLLVLAGGGVSAATINAGGFLVVNGGSDVGASVSSGATETVSAGSAVSDLVFGAAIVDGGFVSGVLISGHGQLTVNSGASVTGASIASGASELVLGSATGDLIFGVETVSAATAVVTSETVFSGGQLNLEKAGTIANNTVVSSGGALNINGGITASNTTLAGAATVDLQSPKATLSGFVDFAGGHNTLLISALQSTSAGAYGDQAVISGFSTTDQIDIAVLSPGATLSFTSNGDGAGDELVTVSGAGGKETFLFAGSAYNGFDLLLQPDGAGGVDLVYNPNQSNLTVSSGTTSGFVVSSGVTLTVLSGAIVSATTVDAGGALVVSGADFAANVAVGGTETVYGAANGDQIQGAVIVAVSAVVSGETVLSGGSLAVNGGASTSATVSAGGAETVTVSGSASSDQIYGAVSVTGAGAVATSETVLSGGTLSIAGGASHAATILASGSETVTASGVTSGDQIYGAVTVNGGTAIGETVQSGGSLLISVGADSGTTILSGGAENVSGSAFGDQIYGTQLVSVGTAVVTSETVYNGGMLDLFLAGAIASDTVVLSGGELNVSGKAFASNTVLSGGAILELQSPKAQTAGTLTYAGGDNTVEILATTTSALGDLALNVGFSSTDKIDLTSGAFVGSALTLSQFVSGANTVVEVISGGSAVVETIAFAGTSLDGEFALLSDGNGGADLEVPPVSVTTSVTTSTGSGLYQEQATDTLLVLGGGSVSAATVDAGGFLTVDGGLDLGATIVAGGLETISAGSASGDQIFGSAVVSGGAVTGETVFSGGALSISDGASASNAVLSGGGVADLASPTATLAGSITFAGGGNTLIASAIASSGFGDTAVISGFSTADKIDVTGIAASGATLSFSTDGSGDSVATISGTGGSESFVFSSAGNYNSSSMSLLDDGAGGVDLILDTTPVVTFTSTAGQINTPTDIVNGTVDTAVDPEAIGTTVTVTEGATVVGTATVGANGQWAAKVTFTNDSGANVLTASDTDVAGFTGVTSQTLTYNVNTAAAAFIAGDLVISFSGGADGSGSYADNAASPLTLEQITTTGSVVSQIVLPQVTTVVNGVTEYAISSEYGSQSEGSLQLSADGHSLVIAGYGVNAQYYNANSAAYGTPDLAQTTSVAGGPYIVVPRVIADINADGVIDTSTALLNVSNENNPRSVATVNGTSFYLSGQGIKGDTTQGLVYAVDGSSSATTINDATDTRTAVIYNGQLYVSSDSTQAGGVTNISDYGDLPTSATAPTVLTGLANSIVLTSANANTANAADVGQTVNLSPENFFFANADTIYVADSGNPKEGGIGDGGLQKWVYNGSTWTLAYTLSAGLNLVPGTAASGASGLIGLTGKVVGGSVELYATSYNLTDIEPTYVYAITDQLSATTGAGESFATIFTAAPGSNVRGIAFAPTAVGPTIAGTVADQTTTSEAPVTPFSSATITDPNSNANETLTITVGGAGGVLSGAGLSGGTGGVYTLTESALAVTDELQALSFTATAGQANTSSTTTFALSDVSTVSTTPVTDSTTTVIDSDPAVAPTISGTVGGQVTTSEAAVTPFSGVTIADANANASDTLTITVTGGGVLSGAGLTGGTGGVYSLTGSASAVTSELDALSYTPAVGAAGGSATSTLTLSDVSTAYGSATVDSSTTVIDRDPPTAPTIASVTGSLVQGTTFQVSGVGQSGDLVSVLAGSVVLGQTTVVDGTYILSLNASALSAGAHTLTATEIDGDGLTSAPSAGKAVTIDNAAVANLSELSGGGVLTGNATTGYTLNLGTVAPNGAVTVDLGVTNGAAGPAASLGGSFAVSGSSLFTNLGTGGFSGLAAGQLHNSPVVRFNATAAGTYSETLTLSDFEAVTGFTAALASQTITIEATVDAVLTTGVDTIVGGQAGIQINAAKSTLSHNDDIDPGANSVLNLIGGGAFNLATPATLANIVTVNAAEGVGTAAQTITTRAGLDLTVDVAGSHAAGAKITLVGAANNDVFNLGFGADKVTLGGAGETVNGGGGVNTIDAASSVAGALIHGDGGTTTLTISGGGTAALNAADSGITQVDLAANSSAYSFTANAQSGLVVDDLSHGLDTLTAGGAGQTLTGGAAGKLTLVGASAGDTTFRDTAVLFNKDNVYGFTAAGDAIDVTNLSATGVTGTFTETAGGVESLKLVSGRVSTTINLFGQFVAAGFVGSETASAAGFSLGADGASGTKVTWHAPA